MLGVGDKFPEFKVKATVGIDKNNAFKDLTHESYPDKWKVYFFWPKGFHLCLPDRDCRFRQAERSISRS